ncbi:MAG: hypothetical protein FJX77_01220 [Armatimonadetes bacterium]|nr:hypothetical protein [Armatimonadota bacterium]
MSGAWRAGTAKTDITPRTPIWLAGYGGRDRPSEGVLHPIWVRALALEDGAGERVVLLTTDLCGLSRDSCERIYAGIASRCGMSRERVLLTSTHNHCSPVTEDSLVDYYPLTPSDWEGIRAYTRQLEQAVVEVAERAGEALEPVRLETRCGFCDLAVNRRNNRETEVAAQRASGGAPAGPVDHRVPVLSAVREDGSLLAVVFGYACHPTTLSFYRICGDYPGFAQLALEERFPQAMTFFWTGCGGDQNPLPRRTVELCAGYGAQLATAVQEALRTPGTGLAPTLRAARAEVPLPFERLTTPAELARWSAADSPIRRRWATRWQRRLAGGESPDAWYPYPIQLWTLGRQRWFALGSEAVVDFALRIQREFGADAWACGYAHELIAYIPSRRVWEEGGYEGGNLYEYGLPAERWAGDVEERIFSGLGDLVQALPPHRAAT